MKKSASTPRAANLNLPPYGYMHGGYLLSMQITPVPEAFRMGGRPATVADYDAYIDRQTAEMADFLWPRWNLQSCRWEGRSQAHAEELTHADLALMKPLRQKLDEEVIVPGFRLLQDVQPTALRLGKSQHGMFKLEDSSAKGTIDLYLKGVKENAPDLLDKMKASVDAGFARLGQTNLRFKQEFQRPRPYQVAMIYGDSFDYEYGAVAVTPSLISGHCMQGLFVRSYATVVNQVSLAEHLGAIDALRQYCIEIGDRRVYAGVHYPSDNIASWFGALRLCDHCFDGFGQQVKEFIWKAIQCSAVFAAIQNASNQGHSVYKPLLAALEAEAGRKVGAPIP